MSFLFHTFIPSTRRRRQPQPRPAAEGSELSTPSNGDGKQCTSVSVEPASMSSSMYRNPYEERKEDLRYPGEGRRLANFSLDSEEGHELEQGESCFGRARK
jgi:hypothetical protein